MSENYENIEIFKVHNILVGININSNTNLEYEILLNHIKKYDELFNEKLTESLILLFENIHTNDTIKKIYNQMDLTKWKEQKIRDNIVSYLRLKNKDIWYNEISKCEDVLYSLGKVAYFVNEELKMSRLFK